MEVFFLDGRLPGLHGCLVDGTLDRYTIPRRYTTDPKSDSKIRDCLAVAAWTLQKQR